MKTLIISVLILVGSFNVKSQNLLPQNSNPLTIDQSAKSTPDVWAINSKAPVNPESASNTSAEFEVTMYYCKCDINVIHNGKVVRTSTVSLGECSNLCDAKCDRFVADANDHSDNFFQLAQAYCDDH